MQYGIIIGIVILSVIVALYFNRRDLQSTVEETPTVDEDATLLGTWTKKDLQEYSLTKYNTKLPNSMKKQDMIDSIVNMSNEV